MKSFSEKLFNEKEMSHFVRIVYTYHQKLSQKWLNLETQNLKFKIPKILTTKCFMVLSLVFTTDIRESTIKSRPSFIIPEFYAQYGLYDQNFMIVLLIKKKRRMINTNSYYSSILEKSFELKATGLKVKNGFSRVLTYTVDIDFKF
ncbi:hypothetical protein BpHYR1_054521 [Brachionus plicatilis]|uniref:Uncharacterized protein n=1 Tax=Brachionus plicatilis TaxID=10195 RepID=A0A3M7S2C6_BRAPC|nr:hypothetical protein BpHYR1_054521 [Brachionus plicatilis]